MSLERYAILVLVVAAASFGALALAIPAGSPARPAVGLGAALAALNTLAAHALVRWSERRSTRAFLGAVLGGMALRMALLLAAVVASVLVLGLPRLPLVVSLLGYFTFFMVIELVLQHRRGREATR